MTKKTSSIAPLPPLFREVAPNVVLPDPLDAPSLRWGIIGPGGIARSFARDLLQYSTQQVVAVGSRDLGRAQGFAENNGIPASSAYGSYTELVTDPNVDIVYIATPHMLHHEQALLALNAGKPIVVEKPFTTSVAHTKEIFEVAGANNLFAMEGMWARHLPHYHFIRDAITSGVLGRLVEINADHGRQLLHVPRLVEPELAGGAMLDLGVYPVSLVQMAMGKPKEQRALGRLSDKGVDIGNVVIGKHDHGLSVAISQMDGNTHMPALLTFENGTIQMPKRFYQPTKVKLTVYEKDAVTGDVLSHRTEKWDARTPGGFQFEGAEAGRQIAAGALESPAMPWSATIAVQEMMNGALTEIGVRYPFD